MRLLCVVERNAGPARRSDDQNRRWSCGLLTREAVSMKSTKIAKGLAAERVAAVPTLLAGGKILRLRRPMATPPCRPTSRPCPAGKATSGAPSRRAHRAHRPHRAHDCEVERAVSSGQAKAFEPAGDVVCSVCSSRSSSRRVICDRVVTKVLCRWSGCCSRRDANGL
jgi:hypothetical protein